MTYQSQHQPTDSDEPETMTLSKLAGEMYDAFEGFKRDDDDTTIYKLKDGSPQWMTDVLHDAHGDMFPDDWKYECVMDACSHISDRSYDTEDEAYDGDHEFADGHVDVYTHDRLKWLASNLTRPGICDEAVDELGSEGLDTVERIGLGQYAESREVYTEVVRALAAQLDEINDATT